MKAIIPVAGEGTRLRPHTHSTPKVLLHVAGKPILGHILDTLKSMGVEEVILITGYRGEQVVEYVSKAYDFRVHFTEQTDRMGLGHAIFLARHFVPGDEPVMIILGDTIFEADFTQVTKGDASYIGVKAVEDPQRFGIVELDHGRITRMVEKPQQPASNLAVVGIYYLLHPQKLFGALEEIIRKDLRTKGEYQLTDALQRMIESGEEMRPFTIEGWYDCGTLDTMLTTNHALLQKHTKHVETSGSVLIDPVYIEDGVRVENSIIGPDVSVAGGSEIRNSIITNSIINKNAKVSNLLLTQSLVGENAQVSGNFYRLNVGHSSQIEFS